MYFSGNINIFQGKVVNCVLVAAFCPGNQPVSSLVTYIALFLRICIVIDAKQYGSIQGEARQGKLCLVREVVL